MALEYEGTDIAFDPYFNAIEHASTAKTSATADRPTPVSLVWDNLQFSVPVKGAERKVILDNISGAVASGQMLAILGPSGSGKTSLLNLLAGRATASKSASVSGSVTVNGAPRDYATYSHLAAYVQQDDDMFGELTVTEQVTYAAALRLPSKISKERKALRVQRVIDELGLSKVRDSPIGDEIVRGVSGGERKRVSIATELVADSPLLFLDEPTSGLDSFNALNVMSTLRRLASTGRTIVSTIHQPRSSIFSLFDLLLVLSEGRTMYFGPASEALDYFANLEFPSPAAYNPADFFLDLVSTDPRSESLEADTKARIEYLSDQAKKSPWQNAQRERARLAIEASGGNPAELGDAPAKAAQDAEEGKAAIAKSGGAEGFQRSWGNEFRILASRAFKIASRSQIANMVRLVQTIFFAIVLCLIWANNGRSDELTDRSSLSGLLLFISINQAFIGVFSVIFAFPVERSVVNRERASASYRTSSYYLSKLVTEVPRTMFFSMIFSLIIYWSVGFKNEVGAFFKFYLFILALGVFGESLAVFVSIMTGDAQTSASIAPVIIIISVLFAGFFTQTEEIPSWVRWIKWVSFVFYGFNAVAKSEFPNRPFGDEILSAQGFNNLSYWENMAGILGIIIAFRIFGYLALKYLRGPKFLRW